MLHYNYMNTFRETFTQFILPIQFQCKYVKISNGNWLVRYFRVSPSTKAVHPLDGG